MNKNELITAVAERSGLTVLNARKAVDALDVVVTTALRTGGEVRLGNLGKLKVKRRAGHPGRNPRTGEAVDVPARNVVTFSPSQPLKQAV